MNRTTIAQEGKTENSLAPARGMLQRKCACGNKTAASGECAECGKKKNSLQRKLAIGASDDSLEHEADRVADQVMAMPFNSGINTTPPRIQRFTGPASDGLTSAPSSVDRVLASSGRQLEPALRQDMEQRFGHDFSRVRVHTDAAAEQSARDVNAKAYTADHNIVFGAGRFAPGTHEGGRLIAHELTHVVQQTSPGYGMRYAQREAASKAEQGTGDQYLDAVLAYLTSPGLEPDYVSALDVLNGLSMKGILDILSELKQRSLLHKFLDHYADNQKIFVLRIYVAIRAVVESGKTNREDFNLEYGYILEKLPEDQQGVLLDKLSSNKKKIGPEQEAAPQKDSPVRNDLQRLSNKELFQTYSSALQAQLLVREDYYQSVESEIKRRFRFQSIGAPERPIKFSFFSSGESVLAVGLPIGVDAVNVLARNPHLAGKILTEMELEAAAEGVAEGAVEGIAEGVAEGAVEGTAAGVAGGIAGAILIVLTLGIILPGDSPVKKLPTNNAKRKAEKGSYTAPRVEPQTEEKRRNKNNCFWEIGPPLGGNNCHDAFAASISGVPREFVLTAPRLGYLSASFDAYDKTQTLHEVKTGHRWIYFSKPPNNIMQKERTARFQAQARLQYLVATHCDYPLIWTFNDEYAREYFDSLIQPETEYVSFNCDIDSD